GAGGRQRSARAPRWGRLVEPPRDGRLRVTFGRDFSGLDCERNHIVVSFALWSAMEWRDITAGAQTERRGDAGPLTLPCPLQGERVRVRGGRCGASMAVRTAPAAVACPWS